MPFFQLFVLVVCLPDTLRQDGFYGDVKIIHFNLIQFLSKKNPKAVNKLIENIYFYNVILLSFGYTVMRTRHIQNGHLPCVD